RHKVADMAILFFLLFAWGSHVWSANSGLHVCDTKVATVEVAEPRIFVDEHAASPGCFSLPLSIDATSIRSVKPLDPQFAVSIQDHIVIQGPEKDGHIVPSEVTTSVAPAGSSVQPMPFQENLLPGMTVRTFGIEERVKANLKHGRLHVECKEGTSPAGILLKGPWYLPLAQVQLKASAMGTHAFRLHAAD